MKLELSRIAPPRIVILDGCTRCWLNRRQRYGHIVEIYNAGNGLYLFALSKVSQ